MKIHKSKKVSLAVAAAFAFAAFLPAASFAAQTIFPVAGDKVTLNDVAGEGSSNGGAFRVDVVGKGTSDDFHTFCLEHNETFSYGEQLTVLAINTAAVKGGLGGQTSTNFDPLDGRTAWLYTQYNAGTLAGYTYDNASGNALQDAIWFIEGEIGSVSGAALGFVNLANASGWSTYNTTTHAWVTNTIGNVRVMNLVHANGTGSQDQVTMVPEPETYAMLLAGLGLMGFVARRRRKGAL